MLNRQHESITTARHGSEQHSLTSFIANTRRRVTQPGFLKCMQQSTVGVRPEDKELLNAYEVYKSAPATRALQSELDKTLYADAIIDPPGLAPLSYLCAKALAKRYEPNELVDIVGKDPLILRTYFDTLDIDLPLEKCYYIDDEKYWYRYVSTRHKDKSLQVKKLNWKNLGITMKFVQYLQQQPAEYWNEEAMRALAEKINYFVTDLHIEHLQTVKETTLLRHLKEDDMGSTSSSDSSTYLPTSSESVEMAEEEEESYDGNQNIRSGSIMSAVSAVSVATTWSYSLKSIDASGLWYVNRRELAEKEIRKEKRKEQRQKKKRRQERRERRALLEEKEDLERELAEKAAEEKAAIDRLARRRRGKGKKDDMMSVFDIEVEPPEENIFKDVSDGRNPERIKRRLKALKNPSVSEYCHHLNLRFLRHFPYITTLSIEFNGPPPPTSYEDWHFDFSTRDIERLADGIRALNVLKIFRLRNSRMNGKKLYILARSLKNLYTLQSIDFGFDNLNDDCGDGLYELFQNTLSIKSLELAGNELCDAICDLAIALGAYEGSCQYLDLGGNPLSSESFHIFCSHIINTSQIKELGLRGARLPQTAISSCIARQLIQKHTFLRGLDLAAVQIEYYTACELLKALKENRKIRKCDVRGCGLPAELELEFEILLKRNKFLFSYPAIGDTRKSIDYIDESIAKTRNKILLRALDGVNAKAGCLKNRPREYEPHREIKSEKLEEIPFPTVSLQVEEGEAQSSEYVEHEERTSTISQMYPEDPNTFNESEIKSRFWFFEPPNRRFKSSKKIAGVLLHSN